jgi:hypothetical protein
MFTYKGGNKVGQGTYWDLSTGRRIDMSGEGILSGDGTSTYYRMSSAAMLIIGPLLGLLYVVLLPFIGIATIAMLMTRKIVGGLLGLIGRSLSFGWRPKEAYLSGKKKIKKDAK